MAEEQVQELAPVSFQEINQQHEAGDFRFADAPVIQDKTNESATTENVAEPEKTTEEVDWKAKYSEFESNYTKEKETYLNEKKTYEQKIEELNKKPTLTHKDSDLSRLEVVKESSPEKFPLYTKLLFGNPSAQDLWKMDFIEKNPKYADKPDMVDMMLEAEYAAYFDPDADMESKEYKIAAAKLEIAGEQIKAQKLAEFKAIAVADPQEVAKSQQQQKTELAKSWEIPFSELSKTPLKVSQKIALDDKSEIEVDFGVQPEDNKKYNELMGLFILHNDLKPNAENVQKAKDYAQGEIMREKFSEILKVTFQKEFEKRHAEWQKSRNNNRPLTPSNIATDGKKSSDQSILEMLEHGETYVPNS